MKRLAWVGAGAAALMLSGCGKDWEPGVKAIEELAPVMDANLADCMMGAKNFGDEANKKSDGLMKLPSKYGDDFKDQAGKLKEKFGARLEAPCTKVVDGAKKCRMDGAPNISGHGQSVIDVCKAVKGIDAKLAP